MHQKLRCFQDYKLTLPLKYNKSIFEPSLVGKVSLLHALTGAVSSDFQQFFILNENNNLIQTIIRFLLGVNFIMNTIVD